MTQEKQQVHDFWDEASCGETLLLSESDKAGYNFQSSERYRLEPYIHSFAEFDNVEGKKVLEIGTGSGYQTAILAQLVEKVYSVERIKSLQERARGRLAKLGIKNIRLVHSDGRTGLAEFAPYNAILSAAAPHEIPGDLLKQLAPNGILIIPVGTIDDQELRVITRDGESLNFREKVAQKVRFVPLVKGLSN